MPISDFIRSFFTSSGPGGVVVVSVIVLAATIYYLLTRWILEGGREEQDRDRYR